MTPNRLVPQHHFEHKGRLLVTVAPRGRAAWVRIFRADPSDLPETIKWQAARWAQQFYPGMSQELAYQWIWDMRSADVNVAELE